MIKFLIIQFISAFLGSVFFAVTLNASRKEVVWSGLTGACGWAFYCILLELKISAFYSMFLATIIVSLISRFLSHIRQAPSTVFLIPGILPLVPGAGIYYTLCGVLEGNSLYGFYKGVETFKMAGAIALGIMIITSLPYKTFNFIKIKRKNHK